jgi:hypothetical protein
MNLAEFSEQLSRSLVEFCWDEWAQLGVLAGQKRISPWVVDPEALIVFTLEVARADPRLFDEVLDWMLLNERLLSVRRLRAMCNGADDRILVQAVIGWLDWQRPRARLKAQLQQPSETSVSLFHGEGPLAEMEPSFEAAGLLRSRLLPSHKSRAPDLAAPINLGFRLRAILGVGIRAEVIRIMLTIRAPWMTAQALGQLSGYSKRNVHEALTGLTDAQVLAGFTVSGEERYSLNKNIWAALLQCSPDTLPEHRDWPQVFSALRGILRWSEHAAQVGDSEYLLASNARQLLDQLRSELSLAGIFSRPGVTVDDAREELEKVTYSLLSTLGIDSALGL